MALSDQQLITLHQQAERRLRERDFAGAHALTMQVLAAQPNFPASYSLLAQIALAHDQYAKAAEVAARAIRLAPDNASFHALLARCLLAQRRAPEALAATRHAASLQPDDAQTLDTLGVLFSRLGRHEEALPYLQRAAERAPDQPEVQYNLGASAQFSGHFEVAERAYRRVLELTPAHARALVALAGLQKATSEENQISQLQAAFADTTDVDECLQIGHAIAKQYEDLGDQQAAMQWLGKAKSGKLKTLKVDRTAGDLFAAARSSIPRASATGFDAKPIFVVGMPRTGTTLADRILSSHQQVVSAGELATLGLVTKQATQTPSNYVLDAETLAAIQALDGNALTTIGQRYIEQIPLELEAGRYFVDKMPLNFFYAGLITRAFPDARIVCVRRHPLDTVLANYRQLFSTSFAYYDYSYDLETTAQYYLGFHRLAEHWRENLPGEIYREVQYEEIVDELEASVRDLLEWLGLDFDPACLNFHENQAPVATASSVQVRQPLYSTSRGRWRRVEHELASVRQLLESNGVDCS